MSSLPLPDLAQCAVEPIRVPGAIQPHGRMAVLSAHDGKLLAYSANWPSEDAARRAADMLPLDLDRLPTQTSPAWLGNLPLEGRTHDVAAHRVGDHVIIEYEPAGPAASMNAPIYAVARELLPLLQQADSIDALCQRVAREMKRLTGFGRCLVYRFDADGHGEVLAERADAGYPSYARHRFPATDVPSQARALYLANQIRLIPEANYEPVPLLAAGGAPDPSRLDLSFASLRSVSPVHLEYMRNMGTAASMSVSIVSRGRLWGLVSCHDHAAKYLPFQTRVACEHLGRLLSLQIQAQEDGAEVALRLALHQRVLTLVALMAESDGTLQRLVAPELELHRLADADGAAVVLNDSCWTIGNTPQPDRVRQLAHWVVARGEDLFETDRLPEVYPEGEALLPDCAGVLAVSISQVHRHVVMWFRPELVRTIRWAGDPRKTLPSEGRVHPRLSFDSWQERVRGRSGPWPPALSGAVLELRQALIAGNGSRAVRGGGLRRAPGQAGRSGGGPCQADAGAFAAQFRGLGRLDGTAVSARPTRAAVRALQPCFAWATKVPCTNYPGSLKTCANPLSSSPVSFPSPHSASPAATCKRPRKAMSPRRNSKCRRPRKAT